MLKLLSNDGWASTKSSFFFLAINLCHIIYSHFTNETFFFFPQDLYLIRVRKEGTSST